MTLIARGMPVPTFRFDRRRRQRPKRRTLGEGRVFARDDEAVGQLAPGVRGKCADRRSVVAGVSAVLRPFVVGGRCADPAFVRCHFFFFAKYIYIQVCPLFLIQKSRLLGEHPSWTSSGTENSGNRFL